MSMIPQQILLATDAVGGTWTYARELAATLSEAGIAMHIVVLGPAPGAPDVKSLTRLPGVTLEVTNLPLDWTAERESALDEIAATLAHIADQRDVDLVHLNAPATAGTKPWRQPLVITAHSCIGTWWKAVHRCAMPDEMIWHVKRTAQGLALADAVIAPSLAFGRTLAETYGAALPVHAVLNGRTMPHEKGTGDAPRRTILTAGRLWDKGKGLDTLDAAAALISHPILAAGPVSGPGGETARVRNLNLLGTLDETSLARWYSRTQIFVSAARYEPFGYAVLEAAARGAALILADQPVFRELWEGAAVFCPGDSPEAFAAAIDLLADDAEMRAACARRARARAALFTASAMAGETRMVYLDAALKSRGRETRSAKVAASVPA